MSSSSSSPLNPSARTYIPLSTTASTSTSPSSDQTFPQMLNLQEELVLYILSFVSDIPYESSSNANESTLTHVIPLVCKKFYIQYATSDYLWKAALIRLVSKEPLLWGHGVKLFLTSHPATDSNMNSNADVNENNNHSRGQSDRIRGGSMTTSAVKLVTDAGRSMEQILQTHQGFFTDRYNNNSAHRTYVANPVFCELYRYVLFNNIRFTSPLFYMPDNIQLGHEFGLHFFEPRYRLLIAEVMAPYPNHVNGEPIRIKSNDSIVDDHVDHGNGEDHELPSSYPCFIYANKSPLKRGSIACIVEVKQCIIHANSTADVYLNPISYAKIEHVWVRPHSHNLYEARVMMLNRKETKAVMDQSIAMTVQWPHPSGGVGNYGDGNNDDDENGNDNDEDDDDATDRHNDYINAMLLQLMAAANRERNDHGSNSR